MDPFIGQIQEFGFNFAPQGWARCDGQLLPISEYDALFALIGTTYGGDGQTTFALPDLRGRSIVHPGQGPGLAPIQLGEIGGQENVTLTVVNMPSHSHIVNIGVSTEPGTLADPQNNVLASHPGAFNEDVTSGALLNNGQTSIVGGSQPFNIRNPYLGINVCIALYGIFPSRN